MEVGKPNTAGASRNTQRGRRPGASWTTAPASLAWGLVMTALAWTFPGASTARADGFSHIQDAGIDCFDCHNIHDGELIPTGLDLLIACQACHNPTGRAGDKSDIGLHPTRNGTIDCGKCHDPHLSTEPNADNIRSEIRYPTASVPVDFPDIDPRLFVRGTPPYDGVCEACHTETSYHRNNDSGDHDHNRTTSCTTCHPHSAGFVPTCSECHQYPQDNGDGIPPGGRRAVLPDGINPNDFGNTSHHVLDVVEDADCLVCHDMSGHQAGQVVLKDPDLGDAQLYPFDPADPAGLETFCLNCHDADGALAGGGTQPFSDGVTVPDIRGGSEEKWTSSAHRQLGYWRNGGAPLTCFGDGEVTGCHGNAHGSANVKILSAPADLNLDTFCFRCHTEGRITNVALSGSGLADDIEQAFSMPEVHDLGAAFSYEGRSYVLQCTTCHNPHVVTGKHWDVDQGVSPVTKPDLTSDPVSNPRAVGTVLFGAVAGEKMSDFAQLGSAAGGWYENMARGLPPGSSGLPEDRTGIYQAPKVGSGWDFEFDGKTLPDYPDFCLECHSYKMSDAVYPINWGQGIPWNYDGNPTTWVTARSPHGLAAANQPYYSSDPGWWGNNGNPDPIFLQDGVTRGRGFGHFMRWPYESAERNAGVNFVLSCTDCHESHGSGVGSMLRTDPNNGTGSTTWNVMCNNCHYYYGGQHAGMSCGYASCHEQNSIHRIKKNGEYSGGTFLWDAPVRPDTTPEIERVAGNIGSTQLNVVFTEGVTTNATWDGPLEPDDFVLTDVNNDNPKEITAVAHLAGDSTATLTLSAPLIAADFRTDLLAARGASIWDADGEPAGPWPLAIPTCLDGTTRFQFGEPAGNPTITDDADFYVGAVNDPAGTILGDGLLHGDGVDNYVLLQNDPKCFKATTAMTLEARVKPAQIGSGSENTVMRIFARDDVDCYQLSIWRRVTGDWQGYYTPPDGVASFALWVSPLDKHGGKWFKPVLTDYDSFPIVAQHWYRVRVVWNSAKVGGIPCDIYVDDQGVDGNDTGENWAGFQNATRADQGYNPPDRVLFEGDRITPADGFLAIGVNVNNQANSLLNGELDYLSWQAAVVYP